MGSESDDLLVRFARRQRRALAEVLSRVEQGKAPPLPAAPPNASGQSAASQPSSPPYSTRGRPLVVGITGSGGAGKSTLVAVLAGHLRRLGRSVAVLATDPQSPLTGGALLGDRIRMQFDPADDGIYFRSFSTRGAAGGISAAVGPAIGWLGAFGFDVVLVETVGIGQDQVAVRDVVDRLVLLVTPGTGDEVQWEKAGLIEVADIVAVNKADLPGADRVRSQLVSSLSLLPGAKAPPVLLVASATGAGVPELWQEISRTE